MKKYLSFVLMGIVILGFGCSSASESSVSDADVQTQTSDFTPPTEKAENPPPASAGERRLLTATSTDGIHFTPTGEIFTEQGNVPDIVVTDEGTIYLYYIGQGIEEGKETMPVAISSDNGKTWTYHFTTRLNWPSTSDRPPSDPDIVLLDDGTFRLFFTTNVKQDNTLGIAYAESPDGIAFTYKGVALSPTHNLNDSSTMFFDGLWHMFVLDEKTGEQHHATSTDGKTFTLTTPSTVELPLRGYIISNPTFNGSMMRLFGFSLPDSNIRSFTTTDATTWTADDIALDATAASTLGSGYIQDMAVAELADGSYFMVYVSEYPE